MGHESELRVAAALGLLNLMGVAWLRSALLPGGSVSTLLDAIEMRALVSLLRTVIGGLLIYAILYLLLPLGRAGLLRVRNHAIAQRNEARGAIAEAVSRAAKAGS